MPRPPRPLFLIRCRPVPKWRFALLMLSIFSASAAVSLSVCYLAWRLL